MLRNVGNTPEGLVRLKVLRRLEWRGIPFRFSVTVTVQKSLRHRWPCVRRLFPPTEAGADAPVIAAYIKSLTDPYELSLYAWEVFECLRKLLVVGVMIFFGRGTIEQLIVGLLFCIVFIMIYNNLKPYAAWENDWLQQACQLNISMTLLIAIIMRVKGEEDRMHLKKTEDVWAYILSGLTAFSGVIAVGLSAIEAAKNRKLEEIKNGATKVLKAKRSLNKFWQRHIVYVAPDKVDASVLDTSILLAEEDGGVPYRGKGVAAFLEQHVQPGTPAGKAYVPRSDKVRAKYNGKWSDLSVKKDDLPASHNRASSRKFASRSQICLKAGLSLSSLGSTSSMASIGMPHREDSVEPAYAENVEAAATNLPLPHRERSHHIDPPLCLRTTAPSTHGAENEMSQAAGIGDIQLQCISPDAGTQSPGSSGTRSPGSPDTCNIPALARARAARRRANPDI